MIPDLSTASVLNSFSVHSNISKTVRDRTIPPNQIETDRVLSVAISLYRNAAWRLRDDWLSYDNYYTKVLSLDMTSSPGYPLMLYFPTNADFFKWNGITVDQERVDIMWEQVQTVISGDYIHYYRAFIKNEVHTKTKAEQGKYRLILASALAVQIVWHMVFDDLNSLEISNLYRTPSMQGLILPFGGWRRFSQFIHKNMMYTSIDKSSWDWTAPGWSLDLDLRLRYGLCVNPSQCWLKLARTLYDDAFVNSKILLPDGNVYQQEFNGFMKSGIVNTISTNSHCQIFLHVLASIRSGTSLDNFIFAVGDDTIQQYSNDNYISELSKAGCIIKECHQNAHFVGFNFSNPKIVEPLYVSKHIARLYLDDSYIEQVCDCYLRLYVHSSNYVFFEDLADELSANHQTREQYMEWMDNEKLFSASSPFRLIPS